MSIWDEIRTIIADGKDPKVELTYNQLKLPEAGKVGRPKKSPYAFSDLEKMAMPLLGDKKRRRCINGLCRVRLHAGRLYTCSADCHNQAIAQFTAVVDLLTEKDKELEIKEVPDVRVY